MPDRTADNRMNRRLVNIVVAGVFMILALIQVQILLTGGSGDRWTWAKLVVWAVMAAMFTTAAVRNR